jgi:leucyl/phenylalanyl-tRNA--protein transferase
MKHISTLPWIEPGMSFSKLRIEENPNLEKDFPIAASYKLTTNMLLDAYAQGIFPWSGPYQPILWWYPDPRMVLTCKNFKLSRSLKKKLQKKLKMVSKFQ